MAQASIFDMNDKRSADKQKALDSALAQIERQFGKGSIMKLGKDAMFRQQDMAFADALDFLRAQLTLAFSTDDIHEGVKAFFEKREPVWTGR